MKLINEIASIEALKAELARVRSQKRELLMKLKLARKLGGGLVNAALSADSYSGETYDALDFPSKVATSISWDDYPSAAFDELIKKIAAVSPELGADLAKSGINYYLWVDDDGTVETVTREWWADLKDRSHLRDLEEDDEKYCKIRSAIEEYAENMEKAFCETLRDWGLSVEEFFQKLNQ